MAAKHVSFPNQREQCRLNKFTYTEKCTCGIVTLMCNYPFTDPKHKKGVCRASTCTDMRKTLADDINAISGEEVVKEEEPVTDAAGKGNDEAVSPAGEAVAGSETGEAKHGASGVEEDGKDPKGAIRAE